MLTCEDRVVLVENIQEFIVGKTIVAINASACNCWEIEFTDGTELRLESEVFYTGLSQILGYRRK